ncbi:T9SS type A sorting domain-containing protein [bacterium]|nr:T9SS type A sorting domain-containing protein [bacterium]
MRFLRIISIYILFIPILLQAQDDTTFIDIKTIDIGSVKWHITNNGRYSSSAFGNQMEHTAMFPARWDTPGLLYNAGIIIVAKIDGEWQGALAHRRSDFQPGTLENGEPSDPDNPIFKVHKFNEGEIAPQELLDLGCPPATIGGQMLFTVYHDLCSHQRYTGNDWQPNTEALQIEVRQTVYSDTSDDALKHSVFSRYEIINRGSSHFEEAYLIIHLDPDIGDKNNDYVGYDTEYDLVYAYNGTLTDSKYGENPPAFACGFLPDADALTKKASTATYFKSPFFESVVGFPTPPYRNYSNYAKGFRQNGAPWIDPTTDQESKYPLSGDPILGTGWIARNTFNPTDFQIGISSTPFSLAPDESHIVNSVMIIGAGVNRDHSIQLMRLHAGRIRWHWQWNILPILTSVNDKSYPLPEQIRLSAYPNPFNPQTTIHINLNRSGHIKLEIFDILGRKVETITNGLQMAGEHVFQWTAKDLPSGVYLCRATSGCDVKIQKLVLQR